MVHISEGKTTILPPVFGTRATHGLMQRCFPSVTMDCSPKTNTTLVKVRKDPQWRKWIFENDRLKGARLTYKTNWCFKRTRNLKEDFIDLPKSLGNTSSLSMNESIHHNHLIILFCRCFLQIPSFWTVNLLTSNHWVIIIASYKYHITHASVPIIVLSPFRLENKWYNCTCSTFACAWSLSTSRLANKSNVSFECPVLNFRVKTKKASLFKIPLSFASSRWSTCYFLRHYRTFRSLLPYWRHC